uniref:Uncharacterized protein n=1 Tax=Anguilla anguilla TaxID=7936 RepID=A0A0E9TQS4_ANGAN
MFFLNSLHRFIQNVTICANPGHMGRAVPETWGFLFSARAFEEM